MKSVRCALGLHAYVADDGYEAHYEYEYWEMTCTRCGKHVDRDGDDPFEGEEERRSRCR